MSFRVTQNMMTTNSLQNLQASLSRTQQLQNQASSGKILTKPSDDPSGTDQALQYRSDLKRNDQYSRNAQDGISQLGLADNTISSVNTDLDRVRTLVLQAANGTSDATSRNAIRTEINTIKQGLIQSANQTYNGRPLFGGTANVETAYDTNGNYLGNSGAVYRTVGANASVQVNMTGDQVFGSGASSIFSILDNIDAHLASGTPADISALTDASGGTAGDLTSLDIGIVNLQNRHSEVGARYHRVETMQSRAADSKITLTSNLSKIEDIDPAETYVALTAQQASYQAALAATSKVIQRSLVDFLS